MDGPNGSTIKTKLFPCQMEPSRNQTKNRRAQGKINYYSKGIKNT